MAEVVAICRAMYHSRRANEKPAVTVVFASKENRKEKTGFGGRTFEGPAFEGEKWVKTIDKEPENVTMQDFQQACEELANKVAREKGLTIKRIRVVLPQKAPKFKFGWKELHRDLGLTEEEIENMLRNKNGRILPVAKGKVIRKLFGFA